MRALPFAMSIALLCACAVPAARAADGARADATLDAGQVSGPLVVAEAPPVTSTPAPPVLAATSPAGTTVTASWYGPGLWGNRTACGQVLTPELLGVAHRTLPCGALVTLRYGTATVTAPVVDRGPHVAGREFDLTYRARVALACPDMCRLGWVR